MVNVLMHLSAWAPRTSHFDGDFIERFVQMENLSEGRCFLEKALSLQPKHPVALKYLDAILAIIGEEKVWIHSSS